MSPVWRYPLFVTLDDPVATERWPKYGPPPNLERVAAEEKAAGTLKAAQQRDAGKRVFSKANAISAGSGAPSAPGDTLNMAFYDIFDESWRLGNETRFTYDAASRGTGEKSKMATFEADATRKQIPGMVAGGFMTAMGGLGSAFSSFRGGASGYQAPGAANKWNYA
jgi:hypothetical protein